MGPYAILLTRSKQQIPLRLCTQYLTGAFWDENTEQNYANL